MDHAAVPASSGRTTITPLLDLLPLPPEHGRSIVPLPLFLPGGPAPGAGHGVLLFATGFGLGVDVAGLGVGDGVTRGVGAAVVCAVGAGVTTGVGAGVTAGDVGAGEAVAGAGDVGRRLVADAEGLGSIDGDALVSGDPLGDGSPDGCPLGVDVGGCVPDVSVGSRVPSGVGVGTAAMSGRREAEACCCSSTPPMPRAIVASTRFRTPRLRMSRTR